MLTKRQQQALDEANWTHQNWSSAEPLTRSDTWFNLWLGCSTYFSTHTIYTLMDVGLAAFSATGVYLTPTGERLATILAELPAPLTRRQWQILLQFRDVGTGVGYCGQSCVRWYNGRGRWFIPAHDNEPLQLCTTERTIRILCDAGLIGFDSLNRAHITPLGEELVSLLP